MLAAVTACSTLRVRVDRDPAVPLAAGATWAFRDHTEPEGPEAEEAFDNPVVHQRKEGAIFVDVVDQASGRVAWRAIGQRRLRPGNDAEETMHQTVARIMRDLPAPGAPPR